VTQIDVRQRGVGKGLRSLERSELPRSASSKTARVLGILLISVEFAGARRGLIGASDCALDAAADTRISSRRIDEVTDQPGVVEDSRGRRRPRRAGRRDTCAPPISVEPFRHARSARAASRRRPRGRSAIMFGRALRTDQPHWLGRRSRCGLQDVGRRAGRRIVVEQDRAQHGGFSACEVVRRRQLLRRFVVFRHGLSLGQSSL
jgi:hypothetical protein